PAPRRPRTAFPGRREEMSLFGSRRVRKSSRPGAIKLRLEAMEERLVPTTTFNLSFRSPVNLDSYAGVGFHENEIATLTGFVNGKVDPNISDFHAQVNWGDSSQWFPADLAPAKDGTSTQFYVKGDHVYNQVGDFSIQVQAIGPDGATET